MTANGAQHAARIQVSPCLPKVDVSPYRVIRTVAGLRPYRPSGYVVKSEQLADKLLIHNYGHGGGGISLSWGSSREALSLLQASGQRGKVAVIGAGAMGLTTAKLAQEAGLNVTVYASALPPHTTSNIAGGQIIPAGYYDRNVATEDFRTRALLAWQYTRERMQIMVGKDNGIRWLPTYDQTSRDRRGAPDAGFPNRQILSEGQHPFAIDNIQRYSALYVETGRWLAAMMRDLRIGGANIVIRHFHEPAELTELQQPIIFNCTGLGSRELFGDEELQPVRGQLAILLPQPEIQYAYTVHAGYMFPRADGILLGGTYERGEWEATPQQDDIAAIIDRHTRIQSGWNCA